MIKNVDRSQGIDSCSQDSIYNDKIPLNPGWNCFISGNDFCIRVSGGKTLHKDYFPRKDAKSHENDHSCYRVFYIFRDYKSWAFPAANLQS